jgi:hypothetical protein
VFCQETPEAEGIRDCAKSAIDSTDVDVTIFSRRRFSVGIPVAAFKMSSDGLFKV